MPWIDVNHLVARRALKGMILSSEIEFPLTDDDIPIIGTLTSLQLLDIDEILEIPHELSPSFPWPG
jgi:hypothetical protein